MKTKFRGIKTAAEYRRGELARDILRLVGVGVLVGTVVVAPNMAQVIDYFNPRGRAERKRIWEAIKYLEKRGRIAIEEHEKGDYVTLTKQGRIKFDENVVWELAITTPFRWDKKWRFVLFDVPSRYGYARNAFREKLKDLGFLMYQRSVFIYPYECHEEVFVIAKWYRIDAHVRYVVASEINDMRYFINKFDLL